MENLHEFTLENGLRVALLKTHVPIFAAQIRVHHGALSERSGEEGYAHFLEHAMMNAGTKRHNAREVIDLHARFAERNAYTSLNQTKFVASSLEDDVERYLALFSDIVFDPLFDPVHVEEERRRVIREIADSRSKPDYQDRRRYNRELWGEGSPLIREVLGSETAISAATPADFEKFHARLYHANVADLIMVGGLPKGTEEMARKYLGQRQTGTSVPFVFSEPAQLEKSVVVHTNAADLLNKEKPESSSAVVSLAFRAPSDQHPDFWPLLIANAIFGADSNSRLFQKISRRKGLAYHIGSSLDGSLNAGNMSVYGKVDASRANEAIDFIFGELNDLKQKGVTQEEVMRIQRAVQYGFATMLATPSGCMKAIEKRLDYGWTVESYFSQINAVTPERVREAVNKYFPSRDGNYALLIRDPLKKD